MSHEVGRSAREKGGRKPTIQTPPRCYWVYTRNEVAQGESKVGMVEVSLSVYSGRGDIL